MEVPMILEVRKHPRESQSKFDLETRVELFLNTVEQTANLWGLEVHHMGPREAMIDYFIREREKRGSR